MSYNFLLMYLDKWHDLGHSCTWQPSSGAAWWQGLVWMPQGLSCALLHTIPCCLPQLTLFIVSLGLFITLLHT